MSQSCRFDAGRAVGHVEQLCYPRRVGTAAERRAAGYIAGQLTALGLLVKRDPFRLSHFPSEVGGRVIFAACAALALAGAWLAPASPLLAAVCWAAAAVLLNAPWCLPAPTGNLLPPHTASENLVGHLPESVDAPARVVFMAHYDTKSQLWPTGLRVALVCAGTFACALLAVLGLLAAMGLPDVLSPDRAFALAGIACAAVVGLVINLTGNRSPGALDNGSGVAALLELARTWRPRPDAPAEVVWVATGSEEVGLDGARHFLQQYEAWWQEKPTLLINLESVGAGARMYLAGEATALRLARAVADGLGLAHARLSVLGAGMDHEPFAARRFAAVSVLGDVVRHCFSLHTPGDGLHLIELDALGRAGELATHLAWAWVELAKPQAAQVEAPACPKS